MAVRLEKLETSALEVAAWLEQRPEIDTVLHPAFPKCPGHSIWKRDFTGSSSVFSILFASHFSSRQVNAFVDGLALFKIGWSWGGVTSLVMAYPSLTRLGEKHRGRIVRLNVGLEDPADLIDDLTRAFATLR
jgi:cystathionine beta-lyase